MARQRKLSPERKAFINSLPKAINLWINLKFLLGRNLPSDALRDIRN